MLAVEPHRQTHPEPTRRELKKHLNGALRASKRLHSSIGSILLEGNTPTVRALRHWRGKSRFINKALLASTRYLQIELDRMRVESNIIKVEAAKDMLDERANAARVIERIRGHSNIGEANVARAMAVARVVQNSIASLCATPDSNFFGAPMIHQDVITNRDGLDHCLLLARDQIN